MPEVYEFSAIAGLEIFDQLGGAPLDGGATFTMPFSRVCIEVTDDDPVMSGAVGGVLHARLDGAGEVVVARVHHHGAV